jgi:hypothetical protein
MTATERFQAFHKLGEYFRNISSEEFQTLAIDARNYNTWFTPESISTSFQALGNFLEETKLSNWFSKNIPLVAFHDCLCILISNHSLKIKLSSKDQYLMTHVLKKLIEIEPRFSSRIEICERLQNFDAIIATGSDNSSRYFEYYFGKYPNIIRKNRTSVAILTGQESNEELAALGEDVFMYFGLGCRNVSKLFVPEGYNFNHLFEQWQSKETIIHHHKYNNNYDYQKSIMLINKIDFLDNGFVMITENEKLVSPISVLYFSYYHDLESLKTELKNSEEKIQCIVGNTKPAKVPFGKAQYPELYDFADNIDTMTFLSNL